VDYVGFLPLNFEGDVAKFAPHKALKLIASCKLTSDERVIVHRVEECDFRAGKKRARRCRANMPHIRQTRPDSGLAFQEKSLKPFKLPPLSEADGGRGARACAGVPRS